MIGAFRRREQEVNFANLIPKFARLDVLEVRVLYGGSRKILSVGPRSDFIQVDTAYDIRARCPRTVAAPASTAEYIQCAHQRPPAML